MKKRLSCLLLVLLMAVPMASLAEAYTSESTGVTFDIPEGAVLTESAEDKYGMHQYTLVSEDGSAVYGFSYVYEVMTSTQSNMDMADASIILLNQMTEGVEVPIDGMSFSITVASMDGPGVLMALEEANAAACGYVRWDSPLTFIAMYLPTTGRAVTQEDWDFLDAFMAGVTLPEAP